MKAQRMLLAMSFVVLSTGCATGLNSQQKSELRQYEARGQAVEEKSPGTAAALGLLPGGGSFYGRAYGFGVVNLLLWPISILWDPVSGYDASESINYHATKAHIAKLEDKDVSALDERLANGEIDLTAYTLEKREVQKKYNTY